MSSKNIILKAYLCSSWGLRQRISKVKSFGLFLEKKNIPNDILYEYTYKNEFFLFQIKNEKEIQLFTNRSDLHPNAIYGNTLKEEFFEEISELIKV